MPNATVRFACCLVPLALLAIACGPSRPLDPDLAAWQGMAERVTITRDDWGVPHIHGKSDADAVFGMIYAQAEDDFNRVEMNVLKGLGRTAEAEGEGRIYHDLRIRLLQDEESLRKLYGDTPPWLQAVLHAWADGLNYYLRTHPDTHPKVISRFEPWMPLGFSEGSIGWDIESVSLEQLEAFYGKEREEKEPESEAASSSPGGSNGIALSGALTASGHAMMLINPHTSFFFRAEAQVQSDEGLNAYGAATWSQIFIYQGFNERLGWMHTSSNADAQDEYAESVENGAAGLTYRYGKETRAVQSRAVEIGYRTPSGMAHRRFTLYRTHHGPIVREEGGKWIALKLMNDPVHALIQSFSRMKAKDYASFRQLMELHTNSSNNTVYADADGNIAYFHANFVPRRDPRLDWSRPVDGSTPATEWNGLHAVDESPNVLNPATGWIQNTNNWPYSVSGSASPAQRAFPRYFDQLGEDMRGVHAVEQLEKAHGVSLDGLIDIAFDGRLTTFDLLLPQLFAAYRSLPSAHPLRAKLAEPIALLVRWNRRWSTDSSETALAIFWGQEWLTRAKMSLDTEAVDDWHKLIAGTTPSDRVEALSLAIDKLQAEFGSWKTPWGEINRYQRQTGEITQKFDDAAPSLPVGFTDGQWGSLAGFSVKRHSGTKRIYGVSGNSFVAVVEFGPRVRAKAITAGGESGDPASPYFSNQAERYCKGNLREVYFYQDELAGHVVSSYHPGVAERN